MGILKFLFGKRTKIFDENGTVIHDLGEDKWTQWNNRLKKNPDYDWRAHKGTQGEGEKKVSAPASDPKN